MIVLRMFSRRWLLATLLVLAGTGVLARLGIWQLDRLAERRAFNSRVLAQIDQPEMPLEGDALALDLFNMEYRPVIVRGAYDFAHELTLRNQVHDGRYGLRLFTPLKIEGSDRVVMVDRGWVPLESSEADLTASSWQMYAEPGPVVVRGILRRTQSKGDFGFISDPPGTLLVWNMANLPRMAEQVSDLLLTTAYVQLAPDPSWTGLPVRSVPEIEISEGSHFSYALQWFTFAALLFFGYPFFVLREERTG
jgi:surfeit locus 1 family protein